MRFTIADLLAATFIAAVGVETIVTIDRWFEVPTWVSFCCGPVLVGTTAGMLLGQFRGTLVGAVLGFTIGMLAIIAGGVVLWFRH